MRTSDDPPSIRITIRRRSCCSTVSKRGCARGPEPGLYFAGLHFLYAMSSDTVNGVGRDADWIARAIALRMREARSVPAPNPAAVAA